MFKNIISRIFSKKISAKLLKAETLNQKTYPNRGWVQEFVDSLNRAVLAEDDEEKGRKEKAEQSVPSKMLLIPLSLSPEKALERAKEYFGIDENKSQARSSADKKALAEYEEKDKKNATKRLISLISTEGKSGDQIVEETWQAYQKDQNVISLGKIYACVVEGQEQAYSTCVESSNPEEVGKILGSFPALYKVYLVNESDCDLKSVEIYSGGFNGEEDFIELNRTTKAYGPVPKGSAVLLEELDYGLLDFVLWYELLFDFADGRQLKAAFSINKAYALKKEIYRYSPVLEKKAYHFILSEAK